MPRLVRLLIGYRVGVVLSIGGRLRGKLMQVKIRNLDPSLIV